MTTAMSMRRLLLACCLLWGGAPPHAAPPRDNPVQPLPTMSAEHAPSARDFCRSVGPFAGSSPAGEFVAALRERGLRAVVRRQRASAIDGHRVFASFASRSEAEAGKRQLMAQGVVDVWVSRSDDGRPILAMGFFQNPANARARRDRMTRLGVPAQMVPRSAPGYRHWVDFVGGEMPDELLRQRRAAHPGLSVRPQVCTETLVKAAPNTGSGDGWM